MDGIQEMSGHLKKRHSGLQNNEKGGRWAALIDTGYF